MSYEPRWMEIVESSSSRMRTACETVRITKRLEIDAGHRLLKHEGKCAHLHGHRYAFEFTCEAPQLDKVGRVVDFSKVKELVGQWLDKNWDHGFIVEKGDPLIRWLRAHKQKHYIVKFPPTAENLARLALWVSNTLLVDDGVRVVKVRCYETPTGWADATFCLE
jgi:6-pyruvoyltetrahydropterin/6-carboxytetrahydropterin synthase